MTKQEFEKFESLYDEFYNRCEVICQWLKNIDREFTDMSEFDIWDDGIHCKGYDDDDRLCYYKIFPAKFIYAPDSEIEEYVNNILKKRNEEREERERKNQEDIERRERAELARLKEKYGE
jgi:hypothetical protein